MDRGGLIHISDRLFVTFATIELCVRQHLDSNNPSIVQSGLHKRILSSIEEDNDVQFYWSGLAVASYPGPFSRAIRAVGKKRAWFQLSAHASDFNRIPLNHNLSSILQYTTQ